MATRDGTPLHPDGPLPAPVRVAAVERCDGCGARSHVGTRCEDGEGWRGRALVAEAQVRELEARVADMRADYERGKAARTAYEAWERLGRKR